MASGSRSSLFNDVYFDSFRQLVQSLLKVRASDSQIIYHFISLVSLVLRFFKITFDVPLVVCGARSAALHSKDKLTVGVVRESRSKPCEFNERTKTKCCKINK